MANFLKLLLASCLGTCLALGALVLFGILTVSSIASAFGDDSAVDVKANTVLVLDPGIIPELTDNVQRNPFDLSDKHVYGLRDMVRAIELATEDDDIKGIYLQVSGIALPPASALTLRRAVTSFRESGKFVYSHALYYGQGSYFMASAADSIFLNPTGSVDVRGYGATLPYFKEGLEKAGIDVNVIYAGDFKSAGEPFLRNSIGDSNRLQTRIYLDDLWRIYSEEVAASRNIPLAEFDRLTNNFLVRDDSSALANRFVDGLLYKDQVLDVIKRQLGLDEDDKINTVSLEDYASKLKIENLSAKNKIAVVYAEGNIVDTGDDPGMISGKRYSRLIREIRQDEHVKAIVLRVNSGGGSAMASENIWRELQLAREAGIPVIASMGDVAASGGYYISVACDSIFALDNTITGSIGVIGIVPNFSRLLGDKMGIHFDTVNTGRYSNAFETVFPLTTTERDFLQESVNDIYEHFISRVATGRKLTPARVAQLAKGRVYTGEDALELGLVDRLGGLDEAIAAAAGMTGIDLDELRISEYPKIKDPIQLLTEQITGEGDDDHKIRVLGPLIEQEFGMDLRQLYEIRALTQTKGPQMRLMESVRVQ